MLAKPLSRVLLFALAGAVLAGAVALKQRASSHALLNAEPNASITQTLVREKHGCKGARGYAADHQVCLNGWRKNQERLIDSDNLPGNERATPLPPDQDLRSLSPPPAVEAADDAPRPGKGSRLVPLRSLAGERWAD
jgi:hypothetical protein